ncbi:hypothetical protein D9M69_560080 [compost metagenome]
MGRDDAERHQLAVLGQRHGGADACMEIRHIPDPVIRRQNQQQRVIRLGERLQGSQGNGRRSIATDRFEQDVGLLHTQQAQLLRREESVLLVADQPRLSGAKALEAPDSSLQHGEAGIGQRQELLRFELARQRPQAGA